MFYIFYTFIWLVSWLPLPVLYLFSDILYPIVYYVVGYRKEVARKNLENSFPEKSTHELRKIERGFYRYFCDLFIEIIYLTHISEKEMRRRFNPGNVDLISEQYAKGKSVFMMASHYGNWEWASSGSLHLPKESPVYNVYKKFTNKHFGKMMDGWRNRFGSRTVEMKELLRVIVGLKNAAKNVTFGLISDQTPKRKQIKHWVSFLNQDTPVILGTEQLAKKFDYPVFYFHVRRIKRGYYAAEYYPIAMEPTKTAEYEITDKYMQILEEKINENPEFWLWTHKRWKSKRKI